MKVSEAFPRDFLEAGDLDGRDVTLTISAYDKPNTVKASDGKTIDRPILHFEKTDKKLILNVTNARAIRAMHGNEMDNWVGKKVTIRPTTIVMARKMAEQVGCLILESIGERRCRVGALRVVLEENGPRANFTEDKNEY